MMMTRRDGQLRAVDDVWRTKRPAAPELFRSLNGITTTRPFTISVKNSAPVFSSRVIDVGRLRQLVMTVGGPPVRLNAREKSRSAQDWSRRVLKHQVIGGLAVVRERRHIDCRFKPVMNGT